MQEVGGVVLIRHPKGFTMVSTKDDKCVLVNSPVFETFYEMSQAIVRVPDRIAISIEKQR